MVFFCPSFHVWCVIDGRKFSPCPHTTPPTRRPSMDRMTANAQRIRTWPGPQSTLRYVARTYEQKNAISQQICSDYQRHRRVLKATAPIEVIAARLYIPCLRARVMRAAIAKRSRAFGAQIVQQRRRHLLVDEWHACRKHRWAGGRHLRKDWRLPIFLARAAD